MLSNRKIDLTVHNFNSCEKKLLTYKLSRGTVHKSLGIKCE